MVVTGVATQDVSGSAGTSTLGIRVYLDGVVIRSFIQDVPGSASDISVPFHSVFDGVGDGDDFWIEISSTASPAAVATVTCDVVAFLSAAPE